MTTEKRITVLVPTPQGYAVAGDYPNKREGLAATEAARDSYRDQVPADARRFTLPGDAVTWREVLGSVPLPAPFYPGETVIAAGSGVYSVAAFLCRRDTDGNCVVSVPGVGPVVVPLANLSKAPLDARAFTPPTYDDFQAEELLRVR